MILPTIPLFCLKILVIFIGLTLNGTILANITLTLTLAASAVVPPPQINRELAALLKITQREAAQSPRRPVDGNPELLTEKEQKENDITTLEGDMDISGAGAVPRGYQNPNNLGNLGFDVIANKEQRWPDGRIPYLIDDRFSDAQKRVIGLAMKAFHDETCIRFVNKTDKDENYLYVRRVTIGCYSAVGYEHKARQWVSFAPSCFDAFGTIIHELMHVIGFFHTQSRTDRDNYITIEFDKLQPSQLQNFQKLTSAEIDDQGQPYDFGSLMHYPKDAFAKVPKDITITPKQDLPDDVKLGQRVYFSDLDIKKVNILYKCKDASICNEDEVQCGGEESPKCGKKCDGVPQCTDRSDENGCPKPTCSSPDLWQCNAVKCIPPSWLCDGTRDCPDGEDEIPTNCKSRKCAPTDFDCGKCVPAYHVCDGRADCAQGQDEERTMCDKRRQQQERNRPRPTQPSRPQTPQFNNNNNKFRFPNQQQNNYQQQRPSYNPFSWALQGFGNRPISSYFNPFFNLAFDSLNTVQRHCFIDASSLYQQPAIRLTVDNVKYIAHDSDPSFCDVMSIGYAQINPKTLQVSFGPKENEVLQQLAQAKEDARIQGFVVVIGSASDSTELSHDLQTLRDIGNDVEKSDKFAEQVVTTLRKWNATGLSLQWLKPELGDRAALTGLIRALAHAFQFDPELQAPTAKQSSNEDKKLRLVLSLNVVPEIQPGQNKQFIFDNVDYVNVIPDREETRQSKTTKYTNQLLSSLAGGAAVSKRQEFGSASSSGTWLDEPTKQKGQNSTLKRINIGIEFAPISWTVNPKKRTNTAGESVISLGAPGPLSGTIGTMNVGEICLLNSQQQAQRRSTARAGQSSSMWNLAVDKAAGGAPYAYNDGRLQWVAYETPQSLQSKLKAANLLRFNGVYVVDTQNDDVRGLCGKKDEQYKLLQVLGEVDQFSGAKKKANDLN